MKEQMTVYRHELSDSQLGSIDNAQTNALGVRDFITECLSDGGLRVEFNVHIARNKATHETLFGAVENHDHARILELYCDWFSCWAGEKICQF